MAPGGGEVEAPKRRYRSPDEDSARWDAFRFRDGDIVISSRSKHGTTWAQMVALMLVLQRSSLPAPLAELSPWLDWLVEPLPEVVDRLDAQPHRRVIKTHTPLDGIPLHPRVHYVVVARHPLDAAVALYHQADNIDRARLRALTGTETGTDTATPAARPDLATWLSTWVHGDADLVTHLDSLPGVVWHLNDAWDRRHQPNVHLVHFQALLDDLAGTMRSLAGHLGVAVDERVWPDLVRAATFDEMRARADTLAPDRLGVLEERSRFFRAGVSGTGAPILSPEDHDAYVDRTARLARPGLSAWLHPASAP